MEEFLTKLCTKKNHFVSILKFDFDSRTKDKLSGWCKECKSDVAKDYYKKNKDKVKKKVKEYRVANPEKKQEQDKTWREKNIDDVRKKGTEYRNENLIEINKKAREFRKNNPDVMTNQNQKYRKKYLEKIRERERQYRKNNVEEIKKRAGKHYLLVKNDPMFKLNMSISAGMRRSLRCSKNGYHWEFLVPYTQLELRAYLESLWEPWMNWNNYGNRPGCWVIDHIKPIVAFNFTSYEDQEFRDCWALSNLRPLDHNKNCRKGSFHSGKIIRRTLIKEDTNAN